MVAFEEGGNGTCGFFQPDFIVAAQSVDVANVRGKHLIGRGLAFEPNEEAQVVELLSESDNRIGFTRVDAVVQGGRNRWQRMPQNAVVIPSDKSSVEFGVEQALQLGVRLIDGFIACCRVGATDGATSVVYAMGRAECDDGVAVVMPFAHGFDECAQRRCLVQLIAFGDKTEAVGFDDFSEMLHELHPPQTFVHGFGAPLYGNLVPCQLFFEQV